MADPAEGPGKKEVRAGNLQKGDVVRLNSGGPLMTVDQASTPDQIQCSWITESGLRQTCMFSTPMLMMILRSDAEREG